MRQHYNLALFSCAKEDISIDNADISSGVITGTIADYTSGSIDYIQAVTYSDGNQSIIGECSVSTNGKFAINLSTPVGGTAICGVPGGNFVISDITVVYSMHRFNVYKNNSVIGSLWMSNFTHGIIFSTYADGDAIAALIYVDKPGTMKGTNTYDKYSEICDITVVKGWNKVAYKYENSIRTYSTTIPSGLKWQYISDTVQ